MIAGNLNSSSWCGNKEVADHASILPSIFHDGKHPQNRTKREEATDAVIPYAAESKIISRTLSQVLYSFELLLTYASLIKLMYANKKSMAIAFSWHPSSNIKKAASSAIKCRFHASSLGMTQKFASNIL